MDELTAEQVTELAADLHARRGQIRAQLDSARREARPVALDLPIGRLSRMDALQQQNMAAANRRSLERQLEQVAVALAAHAEGDYGYCRSCDEPIGYARLKARPETPFCRSCQGAREQQGR